MNLICIFTSFISIVGISASSLHIVLFVIVSEEGAEVVDLGCGPGEITNCLAARFPKSHFIGVDFVKEAIEIAEKTADEQAICNVDYRVGDILRLPSEWTGRFDWVLTYDVLHDMSNPTAVLAEVKRIMKDQALYSCVDPDFHTNHYENIGIMTTAVMATISTFVCLPSSMSIHPSAGCGALWGTEAEQEFLRSNGFKIVQIQPLAHHNINKHYLCVLDQ